MKSTFLLLAFFVISTSFLAAQDLPTQENDSLKIDTTIVSTTVIRRVQEKITQIPRGVRLTAPKISFNKTKPITDKYNRFRVPSFWEKVNNLKFNVSEVAFVNWNAGGNNSVSGVLKMLFQRNYKFRYITWYNTLDLKYGANAQEGREPRKTEDAIRVSSTFGYRTDTISSWYYSVKANFNTQFADGFKYPNRDTPISRFMAPGYFYIGAGASFIPDGKKFNLYISPITQKTTFVLDQDLADQGRFGVTKAVLDNEGNVISHGKRTYTEIGFLITKNWETKVAKNIILNNRINLYSDYLNNFGNVDVDWELKLNLKVNKYVSADIGAHTIFDDDIKFDEVKADDGTITQVGRPKIQLKQSLGVGP